MEHGTIDDLAIAPDAWVSMRTVAERLEVTVRTVERWVSQGRIRTGKLGRRCLRVEWASVLQMLGEGAR
jgi:excisionase family DNA binding protein